MENIVIAVVSVIYLMAVIMSYIYIVTLPVVHNMRFTTFFAYCLLAGVASLLWPLTVPTALWVLPRKDI